MSQLKVTQTRSTIGSLGKHKKTIKALGLKRIRHSRTHDCLLYTSDAADE